MNGEEVVIVNTIDISLAMFMALVLNRALYWVQIARLGFGSQTPRMFLRHPSAYQWIALILAIGCSAVTAYSWYTDTLIVIAAMCVGLVQAYARAKAMHRICNDTSIAMEEGSTFGKIGEPSSSAESRQFESESEPEPESGDILELGAFTTRPFNKGLELHGRHTSDRIRLYRSDIPEFIEYVQRQFSDS